MSCLRILCQVKDIGMKTILDMSETHCLPLAGMGPSPSLQNLLTSEPNCDLGATRSCLHSLCNCTLYSMSAPGGRLGFCLPLGVGAYHCLTSTQAPPREGTVPPGCILAQSLPSTWIKHNIQEIHCHHDITVLMYHSPVCWSGRQGASVCDGRKEILPRAAPPWPASKRHAGYW